MVATEPSRRAHEPSLADDEVLALYKHLVFARALDDRLVGLQRDGKIGFHLASRGEEVATLGAVAALREKDWVFHSGREAAAALWRKMPLRAYLSHVFGSAADSAKGRPMPEAFASRAARFAPAGGARGTHITHAVGFAWAAHLAEARRGAQEDRTVTLAFFGEEATSSGDFHTGMNFAGVFKAPTVLFCKSGSAIASTRQTAAGAFWVKGIAYGIPGVAVDGGDLVAVHKAVRDAVARASRGEGATLIEAQTLDGTSGQHLNNVDPLVRVRQYLEARRMWTGADEADHAARVRAEIDAAVTEATSERPPPRESMFDDVYAELPWHLREERGRA